MNALTSSEMRAWQVCQRGWYISYYRCLRRAHDLPSLPNIGTLVHSGLEAFYAGKELDPPKLVRAEADKLLMNYPDYGEQIAGDAELAAIMLEGYMQWIEDTGADADFDYVGSEQMVEVQLEGTPFSLRGKIDARLRRRGDGSLLQLEHKTVGNLTDIPRTAQTAPQFLTYDLLAYLTKPDGTATDGVILNMLRRVKRTPRAKPPFYGRHEVRHNVEELRAHWQHCVALGWQMEVARRQLDNGANHHDVCPPASGREHAWSCSCAPLAAMWDDGSAVEEYLAELYEPYDPMSRYDDLKDETAAN